MQRFRSPLNHDSSQRGVALVVVLIFLLAVTAIGVFGARNVIVSERMARNQLDAQVARQAAEAALRDAERDIMLPNHEPRANAPCTRTLYERPVVFGASSFQRTCLRGQCEFGLDYYQAADYSTATADSETGEPWWPESKGGLWNNNFATKPSRTSTGTCATFTGAVPLGTFTGAPMLTGVARQPEYLIEYIHRGNTDYFRISARGFGYSQATQVVLQSYFRPFNPGF
ncbi:PilX N-terminal domain-containing pilus assembly protein [Aquabacterium sp. A7-Y]|uniref:pilus assembly PilX family protein n=1 Tax=Aquabacterium sp. A7-Y TaxID=1349605 RepID=UPI00223DD0BC|nr:PilX N-terminal domain-containing pilus assembly protein [Aquabacterium sp. A7-Y]MCW7539175.1 PilX N-terminal domain-containing pilus assembly protein [Aquabacterium sp. A7-Y]